MTIFIGCSVTAERNSGRLNSNGFFQCKRLFSFERKMDAWRRKARFLAALPTLMPIHNSWQCSSKGWTLEFDLNIDLKGPRIMEGLNQFLWSLWTHAIRCDKTFGFETKNRMQTEGFNPAFTVGKTFKTVTALGSSWFWDPIASNRHNPIDLYCQIKSMGLFQLRPTLSFQSIYLNWKRKVKLVCS